MDGGYFNYSLHFATGRWQRGAFLSRWWGLYADDPFWVPPAYYLLRRELEPPRNPHLARLDPLMLHIEALFKRAPARSSSGRAGDDIRPLSLAPPFETPVAAALALRDPRRSDGAAYLSLLHCANDDESLERLLGALAEQLPMAGCSRFIGPTGLSPLLGSGLPVDSWNLPPPLHMLYAPPYLPEIVDGLMEPLAQGRVYEVPATVIPDGPDGAAVVVPCDPERLAGDLLPLFAACASEWGGFPPPDAAEAAFLLRWLSAWPLHCRLALVDGEPAGFVLLQPDVSPLLRRSRGGRGLLGRLRLSLARRRRAEQGWLVFGGVLQNRRRSGIGRLLLGEALAVARQQRWRSVLAGPLADESAAAALLLDCGAAARQTCMLYEYSF